MVETTATGIDKILTTFFSLEDEIHKTFGYVEDWARIPLDDHRRYHWVLEQDEHGGGDVLFYDKPLTKEIIEGGEYYSAQIYTQRHLPKWVYPTGRGSHTLICLNPGVDGNKFLAIFDNEKKQDHPGGSF